MIVWFPLGFALLVGLIAAVALKRRGKPLFWAALFTAGTPTGPGGQPGLAYLFPGRGTPTDPGQDLTPTEIANPHQEPPLPPGVAVRPRSGDDDS